MGLGVRDVAGRPRREPDLQTASARRVVIGYLFPQDRLLDPAEIAAES